MTPELIPVPILNAALSGEVTIPNKPEPIPFKRPLAPPLLAPFHGFKKIPVTPLAKSITEPLKP